MATRVLSLVAVFLYVRVSSKHLKHTTSYLQNNARGLLGSIVYLRPNSLLVLDTFLKLKT
jgi:hypothetical protein